MVDTVELVGVGAVMAAMMVAVIAIYAARYKRIPPNTAMILYGRRYAGGAGFEVWMGGGKFIVPIVEAYTLLSLELIPFDVLIEDVVVDVRNPSPMKVFDVSATGNAKISDDPDVLRRAASQLVHKSIEELRNIAVMTVVGHVRGVVASEPFGVYESDRAAETVMTRTRADLANLGIELRSLFLKFRPAGAPARNQAGATEVINRELHSLESRLRRIEEKLGLSPPA